jgi:metal-dependent hydrolase (beta-lactamase superfamily II)
MKQCRKITGVEKIGTVIGGFHRRVAGEEQLINTLEELARAEMVCTGHCTGFKAMKTISDKLEDRFSLLQCGKIIEFSG